jgi:predicted NAD/FAD-binding protein
LDVVLSVDRVVDRIMRDRNGRPAEHRERGESAPAERLRVAVVGAGVAGLSAAYLLSRRHEVELFEKEPRLGGHAHTHSVESAGRVFELDSGFLVYNRRTYPRFVRLLAELGVEGQPSDMSFSLDCRRCRLQYSTRGANGLFAQRRRILDPGHLRMLAEIPRFGRLGRARLDDPAVADQTFGEFLEAGGFAGAFARHYMLPLVGAVWSSPAADVRRFAARPLLRFMHNHGWLDVDPPRWLTIRGGSRRYVEAIATRLGGRLHAGCGVVAVRRAADGVRLLTERGDDWRRFDRVVLATHADQALRLLQDPSPEETRLLGAFRYSRNRTLLHTDASVLPRSPRAWASWNIVTGDCRREAAPVSLTYHLNRLQSLPGPTQFCVSLNLEREPAPGSVLAEMDYAHPVMDAAAAAAQPGLRSLSGQRHTFFAGAHLRYGFHEDGLLSAIKVAAALGCGFDEPADRREERAA